VVADGTSCLTVHKTDPLPIFFLFRPGSRANLQRAVKEFALFLALFLLPFNLVNVERAAAVVGSFPSPAKLEWRRSYVLLLEKVAAPPSPPSLTRRNYYNFYPLSPQPLILSDPGGGYDEDVTFPFL